MTPRDLLAPRPADQAPTRSLAPMQGARRARLARQGDTCVQLSTGCLNLVDTVHWSHQPRLIQDHRLEPLEQKPVSTSDGSLMYVNWGKDGIVSCREGILQPVLQGQERITTELAPALQGGALFGLEDGRLLQVEPGGPPREVVRIPGEFGGRKLKPTPMALAEGRDGSLYVNTLQGLLCFGPERQPRWFVPMDSRRYRQPVLESPDGQQLYATQPLGGLVALDPTSGRELWRASLPPGEGECFNPPVLDPEGNLYAVSNRGVLFKLSSRGEVLWKAAGRSPRFQDEEASKVELDANGNVCALMSNESFHVYTPSGLPLLKLEGEGAFHGKRYVFDFTLSGDGRRAYLLGGANEFLEVGLPRPGDDPAPAGAALSEQPGYLLVGQVPLRKRVGAGP